jgi:hypothetical protein
MNGELRRAIDSGDASRIARAVTRIRAVSCWSALPDSIFKFEIRGWVGGGVVTGT